MNKSKTFQFVFRLTIAVIVSTQFCQAGFWHGVTKVVTAPARATVEAAKDLSHGKPPSLDKAAQALNPTYAEIVAADKETGVTKTLRTTAQLPDKASSAINQSKKVMANADGAITESRSVIAATQTVVRSFLKELSLPLRIFLWGLVILVGLKTLKAMKAKTA